MGEGANTAHKRVCLAVLAAGASRRMGSPKLLKPFAGSTLLTRSIQAALDSSADECVVVTGAYHELMEPVLESFPVTLLHNEHWVEGQSTSLVVATRYAQERGFDGILFMVADQPFVTASHLDKLMEVYRRQGGDVVVSALAGSETDAINAPASTSTRTGNPCLFDGSLFKSLEHLKGDQGAKRLYRDNPALTVHYVYSDEPRLFEDVDTPEDFKRAEEEAVAHGLQ